MILAAAAEPIPLEFTADGVIRVGGTRVPLETVVQVFDSGATPEEIAQDFPVLRLGDVYAVIRPVEKIKSRGLQASLDGNVGQHLSRLESRSQRAWVLCLRKVG